MLISSLTFDYKLFFFATHYLDTHRYIMILVEKGTIKARSQRTDKNSQSWTAAAKKSLATARAEQQTVMSINQLQPANLCEYLCTCVCVWGAIRATKENRRAPVQKAVKFKFIVSSSLTRTICSQLPPNYALCRVQIRAMSKQSQRHMGNFIFNHVVK